MNTLKSYKDVINSGQSVYIPSIGIISTIDELPSEIQLLESNEELLPEVEAAYRDKIANLEKDLAKLQNIKDVKDSKENSKPEGIKLETKIVTEKESTEISKHVPKEIVVKTKDEEKVDK